MNAATAKQHGLARCQHCGLLSAMPARDQHHLARCPRCHAHLYFRRHHSLQRSLALCLAAAVLLIPANVLTIMTVVNLGQGVPDTIMSGIIRLWQADLRAIAAVVFIASIVVPIIKIVALLLLMMVVPV